MTYIIYIRKCQKKVHSLGAGRGHRPGLSGSRAPAIYDIRHMPRPPYDAPYAPRMPQGSCARVEGDVGDLAGLCVLRHRLHHAAPLQHDLVGVIGVVELLAGRGDGAGRGGALRHPHAQVSPGTEMASRAKLARAAEPSAAASSCARRAVHATTAGALDRGARAIWRWYRKGREVLRGPMHACMHVPVGAACAGSGRSSCSSRMTHES